MRAIRPWVLTVAALVLFGVWSNSFIAIGYLLGTDGNPSRFDWIGLTVARFVPAAAVCAAWCFGLRRAETLALLRREWPRLLSCGVVAVPGYNLALYRGQQFGIPAPIASLTTTLVPLLVMVLAALFLGERPSIRRMAGLGVAASGMALIATASRGDGTTGYSVLVLITAIAPLCWSIYSVLSKPMTGRTSPLVWTYLVTFIGTLFLVPWIPGRSWTQWSRLDAPGWAALLYLSLPCTVLGYALWTWLLRHLPASSVGFTVFLNPPLTTASKYLLALLFPATFLFTIQMREWIGGGLTLAGLSIAVWHRTPRTET